MKSLLGWMIPSYRWASRWPREIVGFDVDLAKAVFDLTGTKVTFQAIDWSMKETNWIMAPSTWFGTATRKQMPGSKGIVFWYVYGKQTSVSHCEKQTISLSFDDMKDKVLGAQEGLPAMIHSIINQKYSKTLWQIMMQRYMLVSTRHSLI